MKDAYKPPVEQEDPQDVNVWIDGEMYDAYFTEGSWWVHYGGMTVGHRKIGTDEIEGWEYK